MATLTAIGSVVDQIIPKNATFIVPRSRLLTYGSSYRLTSLVHVGLEFYLELLPPHVKVSLDVEEALTEINKARDVQARVGSEVVHLQALKLENTIVKEMDWVTKTAEEERGEANSFIIPTTWARSLRRHNCPPFTSE